MNWRDLVHAQDHADITARAFACLKERSLKLDIEHRMLHKDGSVRWFHTRGSAVRREDGTAYRMVGTFTDVTDRKRAEDALRENEATLRASNREIEDLAGRLIVAQETERKRLARELHDDLSQKVALLGLEVEQLGAVAASDLPARLDRLSARVGEIATDLHEMSHRLHPFKLEALGLMAAVQSVCRDVAAQHDLAVEFRHDRVPERLPPDLALCLYRIVQEGLRNVVKHSGARHALVNLDVRGRRSVTADRRLGRGVRSRDVRTHRPRPRQHARACQLPRRTARDSTRRPARARASACACRSACRVDRRFDPPIGHEPHQRDADVDRVGDQLVDERERDRDHLQQRGDLPFDRPADRRAQLRVRRPGDG